jgi:hypothetical protein
MLVINSKNLIVIFESADPAFLLRYRCSNKSGFCQRLHTWRAAGLSTNLSTNLISSIKSLIRPNFTNFYHAQSCHM